jgi:chromosome segregation ATPase
MSRVTAALRRRLRRSSGVDELANRLAKTDARLTRQTERVTRLGDRLKRHKERLDELKPAAYRATSMLEILGAQVGALEERLQSLADKVELGNYDATDDEKAEARSLLEDIRDEHRRIRVKFGTMTSYEERVRRLESALADEIAVAAELARAAAENGAVADAPTHGAVDISEDEPPHPLSV